RRHTRFSRDWSSDVCSSDLQLGAYQTMQQAQQEAIRNAALLTEMFQQARLSEVQTRLGALLDAARLQEAARQANLPYQFPTADKIGRASCRGSGESAGGARS